MTSSSIRPKLASRLRSAALVLMAALTSTSLLAQESGDLVELINAYRAAPGLCFGKQLPAAGALVPDSALGRIKIAPGADLQQTLKDAGYQAARAEAIVVTGPSNRGAVMVEIKERYCRSLGRPEYTAVGISRSGDAWLIILAKPLLAPDLKDTFTAGKKVLELVNLARSKPRTCGSNGFPAAPPLTWNKALAAAALAHSSDMANQNYFRHEGRNGSSVGERALQAGYHWSRVGENIAAGQGSEQEVVLGWLASPGHCANIMNPDFAEMGAAYTINQKSDKSIYWTQVFGTPR
jgi:uncharacterized protein YkwD